MHRTCCRHAPPQRSIDRYRQFCNWQWCLQHQPSHCCLREAFRIDSYNLYSCNYHNWSWEARYTSFAWIEAGYGPVRTMLKDVTITCYHRSRYPCGSHRSWAPDCRHPARTSFGRGCRRAWRAWTRALVMFDLSTTWFFVFLPMVYGCICIVCYFCVLICCKTDEGFLFLVYKK